MRKASVKVARNKPWELLAGAFDTVRAGCGRPRTVAVRRLPHPAERHDRVSLSASPVR
jgi:hypothetical protein